MHPIPVHALTRSFVLTALVMTAAGPHALAEERHSDQAPLSIGIGSRVRFTEPRKGLLRHLGAKRRQITGEVTAADDVSVTVRPGKGDEVRIFRNAPGSLKVSVGKQHRVLRSAVGLGLAAAGLAALVQYANPGYCICMGPSPEPDPRWIGQAAVGGAVLGAAIGLLREEDRWAPAALKNTPAASPGAGPAWELSPLLDLKARGAGLAFHFAW